MKYILNLSKRAQIADLKLGIKLAREENVKSEADISFNKRLILDYQKDLKKLTKAKR